MPLETIFDHITELSNTFKKWKGSKIEYPTVRTYLKTSIQNFDTGLSLMKNLLSKVIIHPAKLEQERILKLEKKKIPIEEIIRYRWLSQVTLCYNMVERFNFSVQNQISPIFPIEIYLLIQEIFQEFDSKFPFVFEAGEQFETLSFEKTIMDPLLPFIEISKLYTIPGTLKTETAKDVIEGHRLSPGYIITYIRGEAKTISLWPILIHEAFHAVDLENRYFEKMIVFLSKKIGELPIFNEDEVINKRWLREIFTDIFAIKRFGPMYILSLLNYYERLPYIKGIYHPDMALRLETVMHFLEEYFPYTDIFPKCKSAIGLQKEDQPSIFERVSDIINAKNFSSEQKKEIDNLYNLISKWLDKLNFSSFRDILKTYANPPEKQLSDRIFNDPVFNFDEIKELILTDRVSLAIDPAILLNVVLSSYDEYNPDIHFDVITDSIAKWKIKKVWNKIILRES